MAKFVEIINEPGTFMFDCPGCKKGHQVWTKPGNGACWQFNGDVERPTINPSLLVRYPWFKEFIEYKEDGKPLIGKQGTEFTYVCHSFIRDGKIQFLNDCTHELAGRTVELPEFN